MNRKLELARRLREVREDLYGQGGTVALSVALGVPVETWLNYERGVTMPAELLLEFIVLTGVDPNWLLTGDGDPIALRRVH